MIKIIKIFIGIKFNFNYLKEIINLVGLYTQQKKKRIKIKLFCLIKYKFKEFKAKFLNVQNVKKVLVFLVHKHAQIANKINLFIIKIISNDLNDKQTNILFPEV